ncbi:hypothetical protein AVEN_71455-1 [Araneus ventricosus]|uniref:Uncharacterized protein n=1 Tax=Araneus ventricosus TaxID=182803 RepID=A0A4Y2CVN8_ARAVE|nr:hypothetical protein AVEN_71455-1 [Araneus ventricosus]
MRFNEFTFLTLRLVKRRCLQSTVFMQAGAPPYIGLCVQEVLHQYFTNERTIRRAIPCRWPSRSPYLIPYNFWLWDHLKCLIYNRNADNVATLKYRIKLQIRNINVELLNSVIEYAIQRMPFWNIESSTPSATCIRDTKIEFLVDFLGFL